MLFNLLTNGKYRQEEYVCKLTICMRELNIPTNIRPFVKWPGSKYKILNIILANLPKGKVLIEPFVGSGAIFLNTNYENYILSDANQDLINLYQTLQQYGDEFIHFCRKFFTAKNNSNSQYYKFRNQFNEKSFKQDLFTRDALFLYLNRHGYNGLCRYNKNNKFNVPFGRYQKPYFPAESMRQFFLKAKRAQFFFRDFTESLIQIPSDNAIVYCDPPYVPLSTTANFTSYQANGFTQNNQRTLATLAINLSKQGVPVLISNHFTVFTKKIYNKATKLITFPVRRMISCKANNRNFVTEMLALFK